MTIDEAIDIMRMFFHETVKISIHANQTGPNNLVRPMFSINSRLTLGIAEYNDEGMLLLGESEYRTFSVQLGDEIHISHDLEKSLLFIEFSTVCSSSPCKIEMRVQFEFPPYCVT